MVVVVVAFAVVVVMGVAIAVAKAVARDVMVICGGGIGNCVLLRSPNLTVITGVRVPQ